MNNELVQIITTFDQEDVLDSIANGLLNTNLAACVQIEKINSMYHWKGKIVKDEEFKMTIKTTNNLIDEATKYIEKHHSYEVPEILILNGKVNSSYFEWVQKITSQ